MTFVWDLSTVLDEPFLPEQARRSTAGSQNAFTPEFSNPAPNVAKS